MKIELQALIKAAKDFKEHQSIGNGAKLNCAIEEAEKAVKNCSIPDVVRSAFLVQHKDTLINYGLFDSEEKAKKYINGGNAYAIQEVQIA